MTLASASTELAPLWEIVKGVMLTLTTGGVLWIAKSVFDMRDDVRDLNNDVRGRDGKNGLRGTVAVILERLDALEDRNLAIDAVADIDRAEYAGDERRHGLRSLRAIIRDELFRIRSNPQTGELE